MNSDIADNGAMPWKATDPMKERVNFVLEWERRWNETEGQVEQRRAIDLWRRDYLAGETVELERLGESTWQVRFLDLVIGLLDERKIDRGILMKRKPQPAEV